MSALVPAPAAGRAVGPLPDALEQTLSDAMTAQARLFSATIRHDVGALGDAVDEARRSLAAVTAREADLARAMSPAPDGDIRDAVTRLVRAWPQEKRGDLAGYGAELAILVLEQRPSRRALEVAFRDLKLGCVHLPAIAEVVAALAAVERRLASVAAEIDRLPDRIAAAEARLAGDRRPASVGRSDR